MHRNYLSSGRHDISNNFEISSVESVWALAISLHEGVPNMIECNFIKNANFKLLQFSSVALKIASVFV